MGILSWIILGLIAGALAKWLMLSGGWIATILLGVAGTFLGGFLGSLIRLSGTDGINISSITAMLGALLLLFAYKRSLRN
ncbi:GlsB/YeaQ/YmgE family stress response membrane protein [Vibrio jasicida]|uniref:GlsB/YeaQ/YmgE family stress response membrane protein n=1 Tax=Vibrio jasicida TaxID=766224 RepID=UPI00391F0B4F